MHISTKGTFLNEMEAFEESIEAFNKAIQLWPDNPEIYFRRGFALQSQERYEMAIMDWNTVILMDSLNYNAIRNRAIANIELENQRVP
jgi:tetratricopeptide (TPR) repeat protein